MPSDIRTHLDEWQVDDLYTAATMADNYILNHKVNFNNKPGFTKRSNLESDCKPSQGVRPFLQGYQGKLAYQGELSKA